MRDRSRHEAEGVETDESIENFEIELGVDWTDVHAGVIGLGVGCMFCEVDSGEIDRRPDEETQKSAQQRHKRRVVSSLTCSEKLKLKGS